MWIATPEVEMSSLHTRAAKRRRTITYGDLASALGLSLPRQKWSTVLNPICDDERKKTGTDLTLVVVYKTGPAKGLSRYFSNTSPPQTKLLNPTNPQQVAAFKRELEKVFDTYAGLAC
jgi:hypothetical protein